jgi:hypothetical protein
MIDRMAELKRIALRKSIKIQTPIRAPKYCYVGTYEEFLIA